MKAVLFRGAPALAGLLCLLWTPAPAQPPAANESAGRLEFGIEQRVRTEDWDNLFDFNDRVDDERQQIRYRTRAWMKAPLGDNITFAVGLTQETNQKMDMVNKFDEVIFDTAYIEFRKLFVKGLSLRVGRQPLTRGEGFLLFDGTSGDGSRTAYYNAANLAYSFRKSNLELIGIINPSRDRFLPSIHNQHRTLQDWDDQALGIYYTDDNFYDTHFETYYFYKKEVHDILPASSPQFQADRHVHTIGGRLVRKFGPRWTATGEYAVQRGFERPNRNIAAWGGYAHLRRNFDHRSKPYAQFGYWGMSGDDPNTTQIEGWDPLFSRWPKWSDLYLYSLVKEKGVAYWSNLGMWQAEFGARPTSRVGVKLDYYHLSAYHPDAGSASLFSNGLHRGDLFLGLVEVKLNEHWRGHFLYEKLLPGNYYTGRDNSYFVRAEVICQFTASFPVTAAARRLAGAKRDQTAQVAR